jgi:hypothetical protein
MPIRSLIALFLVATPAFAADPTPPATPPKAGEGCWVRFFSSTDFERPLGRLAEGRSISSLAAPGTGNEDVVEYVTRARSMVLGPGARLVAYAEPGFRDELATFEPRQHVPDLEQIGFARRVASLKVICALR